MNRVETALELQRRKGKKNLFSMHSTIESRIIREKFHTRTNPPSTKGNTHGQKGCHNYLVIHKNWNQTYY